MLRITDSHDIRIVTDMHNLDTIGHAGPQIIVETKPIYVYDYPITHTRLELFSGIRVEYAESEAMNDFKMQLGILEGIRDGKFHILRYDNTYAMASSIRLFETGIYIESEIPESLTATKITEEEGLYYNYIKEHVDNIILAYNLFGYALYEKFKYRVTPNEMETRLLMHDSSKFSRYEFNGYRQNFYPYNGKTPVNSIFQKAWEHHYIINGHHPEHYRTEYENGDEYYLAMPDRYIFEMLLDWFAMSIKFHNRPDVWFLEKGSKELKFHKDTAEKIYEIMRDFDSFKWEETLKEVKIDE